MVAYISLDKTKFYKDDIDNGKIYIEGDISGLDLNKEYCARWKCINNSSKYHVHGSVDYFYITNTTQISLTYNSAHIHTENLTLDTGKNYATVYIYVDAVQYNCENIKEEMAGYQVIRIYDIYKPAEPGTLNCTSWPTEAGIYIGDRYYGLTNRDIDLDPGSYNVKFTKTGYEDFTQTKTITAGETTYISKDLIPEEEEEPEEPTIGEITSIPYPELVGDEVIFKVNIKNTGLKTAFYYVDLWDEDHNFIDKEPDTYLYYVALEPGETGIITISSNWKDWNVDSILNQTIQFDLRGAEITWAGARPIVGYYITDTLTFEYVPPEEEEEEQVIPCTNYTTKSECEANGCYWWESDQTCQSMPEGTTEYFDIIIKPYSWYSYNTAVNNTIKKLSDIGGALSNLLYKYTDIQYNGIDILEDVNKEHIIIRIYIISKSQSDSQISTLVFPAFIIAHPVLVTAIVGVIAGIILFTVGFIIGTSGGNFTKSDITQLLENILKNAKIDAYVYGYDINKIVAIKLMDCLETIETCEDSLSCFTNTGVTPSLQNQMEVLVTYQTTVDAAYTGVADILDDEEYEKLALKTISQLEFVIEKMESATITPDGAACEASDVMDDAGEDLKKKKEEQKEEECAWELFDTCIISKDTFKILTWGAIGVGGLILYSATKR